MTDTPSARQRAIATQLERDDRGDGAGRDVAAAAQRHAGEQHTNRAAAQPLAVFHARNPKWNLRQASGVAPSW